MDKLSNELNSINFSVTNNDAKTINQLSIYTLSHLTKLKKNSTKARKPNQFEFRFMMLAESICSYHHMKHGIKIPNRKKWIEDGNGKYIEFDGKVSWWVKPNGKWTEIPDEI